MLSKKIPTKLECDAIVAANDSFIKKEGVVNGVNTVQYSYLLAEPKDFFDPLGDGSIDAFELRGLTFIESNGGWIPFLFIPKFFNLNQTEGSLLSDFEGEEIESIMDKRDGSAIGFVRLPSGELVGKTKMAFESEQAVASTNFVKDKEHYKAFINECFDKGLYPLFEYTSFSNRVVLAYGDEELKVLGVRDSSGRYLGQSEFEKLADSHNIPMVDFVEFDGIDEIVEWAKAAEDVEGVVVRFVSGKQMKVKTEWYCDLHGLVTDEAGHAHRLIKIIVDESVDDLLARIPVDFERLRNFVENLNHFVVEKVHKDVKEVLELIGLSKDFANRREFFEHVRESAFVTFVMARYQSEPCLEEIEKMVREKTLQDTLFKKRAENWLETHGFTEKF